MENRDLFDKINKIVMKTMCRSGDKGYTEAIRDIYILIENHYDAKMGDEALKDGDFIEYKDAMDQMLGED